MLPLQWRRVGSEVPPERQIPADCGARRHMTPGLQQLLWPPTPAVLTAESEYTADDKLGHSVTTGSLLGLSALLQLQLNYS